MYIVGNEVLRYNYYNIINFNEGFTIRVHLTVVKFLMNEKKNIGKPFISIYFF